tara:strand:+ start:163 stop:585 length:423 start_codon:yes stop_codon:yes gene_type:complete
MPGGFKYGHVVGSTSTGGVTMTGDQVKNALEVAAATDPSGSTSQDIPLAPVRPLAPTYSDPIGPGLLPGEMGHEWLFANYGRKIDEILGGLSGKTGEYIGGFIDGLFETVGFEDKSMYEKLAITTILSVLVLGVGKKSIF